MVWHGNLTMQESHASLISFQQDSQNITQQIQYVLKKEYVDLDSNKYLILDLYICNSWIVYLLFTSFLILVKNSSYEELIGFLKINLICSNIITVMRFYWLYYYRYH